MKKSRIILVVPEKVVLCRRIYSQVRGSLVNPEHSLGFLQSFHQRRPKEGQ